MGFLSSLSASGLQVFRTATVNGYTGVSQNGQYWQTYNKRFVTFGREGIKGGTYRATASPQNPWKVGGDTPRKLLRSAQVDDGLREVSYPIGVGDTCDCVDLPGITTAEVEECDYRNNQVYWGVFAVLSTENECYNFGFDSEVVYANCPSALSWETATEYVLCVVDFDEGIPDGESDPTTAPSSETEGGRKKLSASEPDTSLSKHQENTKAGHTTRIHLRIHRLLTLFVEGLLALQSTSG